MRKSTLSMLILFVSVFFLTQSVFSQGCENFDSYTSGDYVAVVVPGWTTWSNNPGSAEDAMITDAMANSPANSFIIEGGTDLVQLFDAANITSGIYQYSNMMYVADGSTGYFNLQKDVVPGVEWGFQAFFDGDGTATIDAGAAAASVFTFTFDEWHTNMLIVDLDNDYCEYWFDGELKVSYQWSLGTFGTAGAMTLGGANYYANAGVGPPLAYFDDVCFEAYAPGGDCEDFDALTAGDYVAGQLGGYWTTWGGNPGGADDAMVSDMYSNSPDNSFVVDGGNVDLIFQFGDDALATGQWLYSHYMYVPTGFSGYFNVQSDPTPGVDWNLELFFNDDGTGEFAGQSTETFTYSMDTWFMVEVMYDLDAGMGYVYIDGAMIIEFVNAMTIGAIDYYGWDVGGPPGAYYDDVCFGEYVPSGDCENFDALVAGDYVAGQLGGYWTTWGGNPGGSDDAMVSDMYSNSPDNSFVVDAGAVDLIFQFGDEAIASGQWMYSHYIYVPTGFSGYFNVQTDPTPGVAWNLDLYFNDDGTGYFDGQSSETFTYNMDTWIMVTINYDLDAGLADVWFDDDLILTFENTLTIGGIDYYGANTGGTPGAYYDDVCFGVGYEISTSDCEDFDALVAGDYVAGQLGGYWTTWGGNPGGADDALVSDMYSNSPDNSFVVDGGNVDLIFQFGDEALATGLYLYSHYMYVPTGFSGYFNVQSDPTPGVDWNLELFFNDDGTGEFAGQSTETFTYEMDTWIMVEINYDLDGGLGAVYFDGQMVALFDNAMTIGSIDYYGWDVGGPPGAYYDDVCFGAGWSLVGIEELSMSNTIVYPNPARDQITIESESIIDEVRIYNNMGQLVYSGEFNNSQIMVNTSNYLTGMYIVQIRSGEAVEVRKLIVE